MAGHVVNIPTLLKKNCKSPEGSLGLVQTERIINAMEGLMKMGLVQWRLAAVSAVAALLVTTLLISSCSTPMGNPEEGKRWYSMNNCYACHGVNGDDGKAPVIKNLDMSFWRFKRTVRNAGSPIMPKYPEEKISNQDVADLYAFLAAPR